MSTSEQGLLDQDFSNPVLISVVQPTWFRPHALEVRNRWMAAAANPDRVDYVLSMDSNDFRSLAETEGLKRWVNPGPHRPDVSSAVANWNGGASLADGELIFAIGQDLFPPKGWDDSLRTLISGLDPLKHNFAVKISEGNSGDKILRHPIISRAFYRKFGLFDPSFTHLFIDDDISLRAFWGSAILDARHIVFEHQNPFIDRQLQHSLSQQKGNARIERVRGRSRFDQKWPLAVRALGFGLVSPSPLVESSHGQVILRMILLPKLMLRFPERVLEITRKGRERLFRKVRRAVFT